MKDFVLLLGGVEIDSHRGDHRHDGIIESYAQWLKSVSHRARLKEAVKLRDGHGSRVRLGAEGRSVDGPFTELKEMITSLFVIEAKDQEEALAIARTCPAVTKQGGWVEVRELSTCPMEA